MQIAAVGFGQQTPGFRDTKLVDVFKKTAAEVFVDHLRYVVFARCKTGRQGIQAEFRVAVEFFISMIWTSLRNKVRPASGVSPELRYFVAVAGSIQLYPSNTAGCT